MIQLFEQWALGNHWNSWGGSVRLTGDRLTG